MGRKVKSADTTIKNFFNEESQSLFENEKIEVSFEENWKTQQTEWPVFPLSEQREDKDTLKALRYFYLSGKLMGNLGNVKKATSVFEWAMRTGNAEFLQWDYPVIVFWEGSQVKASSLKLLILDLCDSCELSDKIRARLTAVLFQQVEQLEKGGDASQYSSWVKELVELPAALGLTGGDLETVKAAIEKIAEGLPTSADILFWGEHIEEDVSIEIIQHNNADAKQKFLDEIHALHRELQNIVFANREDQYNNDQEHLGTSFGKGGGLIDLDSLAEVIPESNSTPIAEDRLKRLEGIIDQLSLAEDILQEPPFYWTGHTEDTDGTGWSMFKGVEKEYSDWIKPYCKLCAAVKKARLEIDDAYDAEILDTFFDHYAWSDLSEKELSTAPVFIVKSFASLLFENELSSFFKLLSRNIPVKIFIEEDREFTSSDTHQYDLGTMTMAYKNVFVAQTSGFSIAHYFDQIKQAIEYPSTSVIYFMSAAGEKEVEDWYRKSLYSYSRTFPHWSYFGTSEREWGNRFDIAMNPDAEQLWSSFSIHVQQGETNEAMEFQVFPTDLLMDETMKDGGFAEVPDTFRSNYVIPLNLYLQMPFAERTVYVPFQYAVDSDNRLIRVVPVASLIEKTEDRLEVWKSLRDLGGVDNYHSTIALKSQEERLRREFEETLQGVEENHRQDIDTAKTQSREEAIQGLADALLDVNFDPSHIEKTGTVQQVTEKTQETSESLQEKESPEEKNPVEEQIQEEAPVLSEEAYIDTALCTSCNECIDINKSIFKYNADKLAYIADAAAGPYGDLVEAAERCPAGIIHPGTPLNTSEPDLEEWKKRAEPFL